MRDFLAPFCLALFVLALPGQRILLTARGIAFGDNLGVAVASLGDVDRDGVADLAASAQPNSLPGYVHVLSGRDGSLLGTMQGASVTEQWGASLASSGDMDGDGVRELIIGVPQRLAPSGGTGVVEVWSGRTMTLLATIPEPSNNSTRLGRRVLGVDDVERDGVADFLATAPGRGLIRVFSGRTRTLLRTLAYGTGSTNEPRTVSVALFGDVDSDGVREIVAGDADDGGNNTGSAAILNLVSGQVVRVVRGSTGIGLGTAVEYAGDINGDGFPDFAASAPTDRDDNGQLLGAVHYFSGRDGNLLRRVFGVVPFSAFGWSLVQPGDINGDSIADLGIGAPEMTGQYGGYQGMFLVASGATGAILMRVDGFAAGGRMGHNMARIPDRDGDGVDDLLVAAPNEADPVQGQGVIRLFSSRILAEATMVGAGCGGGPFIPVLGGTRPLIGTSAQLVGEWSPPVTGFVLMSIAPSRAFSLGVPGCNGYVDLARAAVLGTVNPSGGRWVLPLPVPNLPGIAGFELMFQVIYGPTLGPIGLDVTGGLRWRIGW